MDGLATLDGCIGRSRSVMCIGWEVRYNQGLCLLGEGNFSAETGAVLGGGGTSAQAWGMGMVVVGCMVFVSSVDIIEEGRKSG